MKATMKTKRFAQTSIAALAFLSLSVFTPANAAEVNRNENSKEIQDAVNRLEAYNHGIEAAISYFVPVMKETTAEYFEFEAAEIRLEEIVSSLEHEAKYVSPAVNENFGNLEVKKALENLDNMNRLMEETLRYTAPSVEE